jgi:HEAT repeat protein
MDSTARQKRIFEARRNGDIPTLIRALRDDPENAAWAARYLGDMSDPAAIQPLIRLLGARDFQARAQAATSLGKLHAVEAVPELIACVDRGPEDVMRAWAIDALGHIGSPAAVPKLIELLSNPEPGLRRTAAVALGAIGDPKALDPLHDAARHARWPEKRLYRRAARQIARRSPAPG